MKGFIEFKERWNPELFGAEILYLVPINEIQMIRVFRDISVPCSVNVEGEEKHDGAEHDDIRIYLKEFKEPIKLDYDTYEEIKQKIKEAQELK